MGKIKALSLASAIIVVGMGSSAHTADYSPEPPVMELPPIVQFGGWYLRGDLSVDQVSNFDVTYGGNSFNNSEIDNGVNFGIGIGYQVSEHFRTDLTLERFGSSFSGATSGSCAYDAGGGVIGGSCWSNESSDFAAWSAMANGYWEMGNFSGWIPYAGAGLGASYVSWNDYRSVNTCTRTTVATDACYSAGEASYVAPGAGGTTSVSSVSYATDESWKFSYALMAGFSYELSQSLKLDLGYKYTSIASGTLISNIGGGTSVDHGDLGIHAVRLGLRYQMW